LYFLDLSFRNTAKALSFLQIVKISHLVSIWNGYKSINQKKKLKNKKQNIDEYSCIQNDETTVNAGSELMWI
jgi:hypothetical protein